MQSFYNPYHCELGAAPTFHMSGKMYNLKAQTINVWVIVVTTNSYPAPDSHVGTSALLFFSLVLSQLTHDPLFVIASHCLDF